MTVYIYQYFYDASLFKSGAMLFCVLNSFVWGPIILSVAVPVFWIWYDSEEGCWCRDVRGRPERVPTKEELGGPHVTFNIREEWQIYNKFYKKLKGSEPKCENIMACQHTKWFLSSWGVRHWWPILKNFVSAKDWLKLSDSKIEGPHPFNHRFEGLHSKIY